MATTPFRAEPFRLRVAYLSGDEIFAIIILRIETVMGQSIDDVAREIAELQPYYNLRVPDLSYRLTLEPIDPDDPAPTPQGRVKPVCSRCGSEELVRDATAHWHLRSQTWLLAEIIPSTSCSLCGAESDDLTDWVLASEATATDYYLADVVNHLDAPDLLADPRFCAFCLSRFLDASAEEAAQAWRRMDGGHDER